MVSFFFNAFFLLSVFYDEKKLEEKKDRDMYIFLAKASHK